MVTRYTMIASSHPLFFVVPPAPHEIQFHFGCHSFLMRIHRGDSVRPPIHLCHTHINCLSLIAGTQSLCIFMQILMEQMAKHHVLLVTLRHTRITWIGV